MAGAPRETGRSVAAVAWRAVPWIALVLAAHLALLELWSSSSRPRPLAVPPAAGASEDAPDAPAAPPTFAAVGVVVERAEDIERIEDPVALEASGHHHLAAGDRDLARACFEAAVARREINHYQDVAGTIWGQALVAELMGDLETSRQLWRDSFHDDVLTAMFLVRRFSIDAQREAIFQAAVAHVQRLVAEVEAGGSPHFYTTSSGASRPLVKVTAEEAQAAFEAGEPLRYAYLERLDVTNATWAGRVGCKRCIVGELHGFGATFTDQFDFHGVVLGEAHLGKRWTGEVNRSKPIAAARFANLYLGRSVFLQGLNLDSIAVTDRVMNLPMAVVDGELDLRNVDLQAVAELRYTDVSGAVSLRGAHLASAVYMGHARLGGADLTRTVVSRSPLFANAVELTGPVSLEDCRLAGGATFEFATFGESVDIHQCSIEDRLNMSRARLARGLFMSNNDAQDLDMFGIEVFGDADFSDNTFTGNVRFAVDELTRRRHLTDPTPLHRLYKQYQGDVDAEDDLTRGSQYGVTHVDDLTALMHGSVSFANTIFSKFVSFEGVRFGQSGESSQVTSFYNAQFYGEAHFERSKYYTDADFRTISGHELSFNQAEFHADWMLDDANVPGRLTMSGVDLIGDGATMSFYGAQINSFNVTFRQLMDDERRHRLFYERCVATGADGLHDVLADPRLVDAHWDPERDAPVRDPQVVAERAQALCAERNIAEFVSLKDAFNKRSMAEESDWAYWHLRHYKNALEIAQADGPVETAAGWMRWLLFEKAFGWGVRLGNLLWTGLAVILLFMGLQRLLCPKLVVDLDGRTWSLDELPVTSQFMLSLHCFLGRARDWRATSSNRTWKVLYITELILGIILITFFIGAYTRMVLR